MKRHAVIVSSLTGLALTVFAPAFAGGREESGSFDAAYVKRDIQPIAEGHILMLSEATGRDSIVRVSRDTLLIFCEKKMARATTTRAKTGAHAEDFSSHSFEELLELKTHIGAEIESRKAKQIDDLRAKVQESARALGVSVEELIGVQASRRRQTKHARGPQPPKYRGPNGEEWSGRGPAPRWMKPLLAKGKTKEDFLIK